MIRSSLIKKLLLPLIFFTVISSIITLPIIIMQIVWSHYGFNDSSQISLNISNCSTYQLAKYTYSKQLFGISFIAILVNFCCEILLFVIFLIMTILVFLNSMNTSDQINPEEVEDKLFVYPRILLLYVSYIIASLNVLVCTVHFGYYLSFYTQITNNCSASNFTTHYIVFFSLMGMVWIFAVIIWFWLILIAILVKPDETDEKNQQRKKMLRRRQDSISKNQTLQNKEVQLTRQNLLDSPGRHQNVQNYNSLNPVKKEQNPKILLNDNQKMLYDQDFQKNHQRKNSRTTYYNRKFQRQYETNNMTHMEDYVSREKEENQQLRYLRPKETTDISPLFIDDKKNKPNQTPKFSHQHHHHQMSRFSPQKHDNYEDYFNHQHSREEKNHPNQQKYLQPSNNNYNEYPPSSRDDIDFTKNKVIHNSNKKDRKGMLLDYIKGKYAE